MDYITIKEAVSLTGKSEATIRRLIKKATSGKPKKAKKEKTASGYQWFISKEFILSETDNKSSNETIDPQENTTIQALLKQLEIKDKQIEELNTRLQEANILHKQLQDHLFERKQLEDKRPNIFRRIFLKQ
jgi:predicted transcriptional regulator